MNLTAEGVGLHQIIGPASLTSGTCVAPLRMLGFDRTLRDRTDILSVALAAGFSHHGHFTIAFRRALGTSPSDFRAAVSRSAASDAR